MNDKKDDFELPILKKINDSFEKERKIRDRIFYKSLERELEERLLKFKEKSGI